MKMKWRAWSVTLIIKREQILIYEKLKSWDFYLSCWIYSKNETFILVNYWWNIKICWFASALLVCDFKLWSLRRRLWIDMHFAFLKIWFWDDNCTCSFLKTFMHKDERTWRKTLSSKTFLRYTLKTSYSGYQIRVSLDSDQHQLISKWHFLWYDWWEWWNANFSELISWQRFIS